MAKALTPKQARFVDEYLVDLNATQAAIRAGYSERTARSVGYENLTKPHIAEAVEAAKAQRSERTKITSDMVVEELAKVGFSDMRSFSSWGPDGVRLTPSERLEDAEAAAVSEVWSHKTVNTDKYGQVTEVTNSRLKLHGKLEALNSLGRHLGMFVERHEHTGKGGGPIEQRVSDADLEARRKLRERDDRVAALKRDLAARPVASEARGVAGPPAPEGGG